LTSSAIGQVNQTDSALVWEQLSERLDAFIAAWQGAAEPPPLAEFLPSGSPVVRRLTLVEAIKVDLEYRWQERRWPKMIEDYLREFPELADDGGLPCDVIYEEYHIRRRHAEVLPREYYDRFPQQAAELERLLKLEQPELTATLVRVEPAEPVAVGQRLDDFDLLRSLGKGAFATVYLARQCSMQRLVALKVSSDRGFEPQTLAQLDHPNIVRVYDQRQLPERKMRLLYMQYVPGGTLQSVSEHVRRLPAATRTGASLLEAIDATLSRAEETPPLDSMTRQRLSRATWPEAVCWIGARLASALAYAHQRGVLHRDVKPANVLISGEGHPKLADFNISFSKLDGATPAAYFGGSLAYMSPEQLEACDPAHDRQPDELDGRSDVYSLGVMLWEMLTGKRPFPEDTLPANWSGALAKMTTLRRAGVQPEAAALLPGNCPHGLKEVLLKCMAPEADGRYASAAVAAHEIELCLQPRARRLLHGSHSWQSLPKRYPVLVTIVCGLLPNMVMCLLNIKYNNNLLIRSLNKAVEPVFDQAIAVVNAVGYVIGLSTTLLFGRWVFRAVRQAANYIKPDPPVTSRTLARCLWIGDVAAFVAAALWILSGPVFPLWLDLAVPDSGVELDTYVKFTISDALSGLIAATQCFYAMTFLVLRFCYPRLLQTGAIETAELHHLESLAWRSRVYFGLAVAVPFLAVVASAFLEHDDRWSIMVLGGVGLFGFALAYFLDVSLRGDLAALSASRR
jgi:serine/threonine protein kinase